MNNIALTCIVDDDDVFVYAMKRLIKIKELSKDIVHHNRVEEAINFLEESKNEANALPDVILLDINLPIRDGWDFLDAYGNIKETLIKKPKVYMLSSSISDFDQKKALKNVNIDGFFIKPLSQDDFNTVFNNQN